MSTSRSGSNSPGDDGSVDQANAAAAAAAPWYQPDRSAVSGPHTGAETRRRLPRWRRVPASEHAVENGGSDWTWNWNCGRCRSRGCQCPQGSASQNWTWNWNWNCGAPTNRRREYTIRQIRPQYQPRLIAVSADQYQRFDSHQQPRERRAGPPDEHRLCPTTSCCRQSDSIGAAPVPEGHRARRRAGPPMPHPVPAGRVGAGSRCRRPARVPVRRAGGPDSAAAASADGFGTRSTSRRLPSPNASGAGLHAP